MRTILMAAFFCAYASGLRAADWSQFRGSLGQGISDAKTLPTKWSPEENIAWKTPMASGWSSPIVHRGRIYLTAANPPRGGNVSLRALCLDAATGRTLWDTEVITTPAAGAHNKNSHASPTPVTDGQRIYVHFGQYGTAALNMNGSVAWRNTNLKYPPVHGNGSSPILVGNALIFHADAERNPFIVALDKTSGFILWRKERQTEASRKFSFSTPLAINVGGRVQVISPASGAVIAYDPANGREIWRVRYGQGYSVVPRPVFGHGHLYVSSGFDRATLYAIRPEGSGDITESHVSWSTSRGAPKTPSPLLVDDELYFVSDDGLLSCADAKTGALHYQERVGGNYSSSPVYGAGHVYVQNEEGVATAVKAGKKFAVVSRNDLTERTLASWALDEGAIFIRTDKHLYRIEDKQAKSGT